eukprot:SAG31_NODE_29778_length_390_cov_0.697595_1_plen_80_part_10
MLQYRPQFLPFIYDKQEPEVWAFGHILYEMATGGQVPQLPTPSATPAVVRALTIAWHGAAHRRPQLRKCIYRHALCRSRT